MNDRITLRMAVAAAILATAGCRQKAAWPPEPAPLHFGEDACSACSMIISDSTYAAQIASPQGVVQNFDDIGCMLTKTATSTDPAGVFVRTSDGSRWIRGDQAYVLEARDIASPMGYGFIAFATRSEAETAARAHAGSTVLSLVSLLGAAPARMRGAGTLEQSWKGEITE